MEPGPGVDLPVTGDVPLGSSARRRLLVAAAAGGIAAAAAAEPLSWVLVALTGWDVAAGVLIGWSWATIVRRDADQTAKLAAADDPTAAWTDVLLLSASIASLVAVGLVLLGTGAEGGLLGRAALAVLSVALSWALVHTVFTLRYAALYYAGPEGGVDFNQDEPPDYLDFAYLAFTIGMTFQVSDTDLRSSAVRHTALRHALLSYVFGAVILAGTINLLAGLTR
jgi:uncharacterized membrane protein